MNWGVVELVRSKKELGLARLVLPDVAEVLHGG